MKTLRLALIIVAGLCIGSCIGVALIGCGSPRAQLRTAADTYASTLTVLTEYRNAGLIDDEAAVRIERWRTMARAGLDAWRIALDTDASPASAVDAYVRGMQALSQAILDAEAGRLAVPSPSPATLARPPSGGNNSQLSTEVKP